MPFETLTTGQLETNAHAHGWIWDGYLAPGQITLFTSVWKSGKTTLLAHLLAQRRSGGTLAGRAIAPGATAVISEETPTLWQQRHTRLGFGPHDRFLCRPFVTLPSPQQWQELIDHLAEMARSEGIDLVAIDPLAFFLPAGAEANAQLLVAAIGPLRQLTQAGLAVLLLHHPRKAASSEGMAARGCGALPAAVDVLLEMRRADAEPGNDRQRRLLAFSRDPNTPRSVRIELSPDGLAFTCVDEPPAADEFMEIWQVLRLVFEDARSELTRQQILAQWPTAYPCPNAVTLWQRLTDAHERGLIRRDGTGHRSDAFRYYLPEKMDTWKDDPIHQLTELYRQDVKHLADLGLIFPSAEGWSVAERVADALATCPVTRATSRTTSGCSMCMPAVG